MNRRVMLRTLAALAVEPGFACAAQAAQLRRIGCLIDTREPRLVAEYDRAYRELGWNEGSNLAIDYRYTHGDSNRNEPLAIELARANPDALLSYGTPKTRALQRATGTIPIVTLVGDPVGSGFASTVSRPGGNVTGLSFNLPEIAEKQLELLRVIAPGAKRMLYFLPRMYGTSPEMLAPIQAAAAGAQIRVDAAAIRSVDDFAIGFRKLRSEGGVAFVANFLGILDLAAITALAIEHRVPTFSYEPEFVEAGGLLSYTLLFDDVVRRFAGVVDKILRGEKPADLPFQLPTVSRLVLNNKTAKSIGMQLPPHLVLRADKVIG